MARTMAQWVAELKKLTADDAAKLEEPGEFQAAIEGAVMDYSRHRPLVAYEEYSGDGSTYDLDLPDDWDKGFSYFIEVEYPAGQRPQVFLDEVDWELVTVMVASVATEKLRLINDTPASGETVVASFSRLYPVPTSTASDDLVPEADFRAVLNLAASKACLALAAKHADEKSSTLEADVVDHGSVADRFRRLSKAYREEYNDHMGIGVESEAKAAMVVKDMDVQTQTARLFRGPRTR